MFKKLKLTTKLTLVISAVVMVVFAVLITITVVTSRASIYTGISGELASIAEFNGGEIQSGFDTVERAALGIQDYIGRLYSGQVTEEGDADLQQSTLYPGRALTSAAYNLEQFVVETARNTVKNTPEIKMLGVMFEPYQLQSDMEEYGFYVTMDTADTSIHIYDAYEGYAKEDSYRIPAGEGHPYISQPYQDGDGMVVAYGTPITYGGRVVGVVITSVDLGAFSSVKTTSTNYDSMWATLFNQDGIIVWNSRSAESTGLNLSDMVPDPDRLEELRSLMAQGTAFQAEIPAEEGKNISCFFNPLQAGDETWWSMTGLYTADAESTLVQTTRLLLLLSLASLLLILAVVIVVLRQMLRPVQRVARAADEIASGNLEIQLDVSRHDEIGLLAGSFQTMTENLRAIIQDIDYMLDEMSVGNFCINTREEARYVGEYGRILDSIRRINRTLSHTLRQIDGAANHVFSGSEQASVGAQSMAQGATEQASAIQELAATASDILEHVQSNAEHARNVSEKAVTVGREIVDSNQKMQESLSAMTEIRRSSGEIGNIIKTIEDIAFQTNILALNAAVEAARAGTAGKGFAVVAEEVRNLAQKSSAASQDTAELIQRSLSAIQQGTTSMNETAEYMQRVVQSAQEITETIQQISEASDQQAEALAQITQGVDQISSVVQTNSATAEQSAAASQEMANQSRILKELTAKFQLRDIEDEVDNVTGAEAQHGRA